MDTDSQPRLGALRYKDQDGIWRSANPGDPLFSTVTMLATHFYNEDGWTEIYTEGDTQ